MILYCVKYISPDRLHVLLPAHLTSDDIGPVGIFAFPSHTTYPALYYPALSKTTPFAGESLGHNHSPFSSPTMSLLEQLPHEISIEIVSYLAQSDLVRISTVSRQMNAISQPQLYNAPDLSLHGYDFASPIPILLRTLLSPSGKILASFVRSLYVQWGGWGVWWTPPFYGPDGEDDASSEHRRQQESDRALFAPTVTRIGLHPHCNAPDAQVMLLLHHLPHLQTLHITAYDNHGPVFSHFLSDPSIRPDKLPLGLQQLREFRCSVPENHGGLSPDTLLILLRLQHIRKIDVHISGRSTIDFDTIDIAPASSGVTELRFTQTTLSQEYLAFILKIPTALEYFSYSGNRNDPAFDLGYILKPLQMSLKHLDLQYVGATKPIGSLRDWPALRIVRCSLTVLLGKGLQTNTLPITDVTQKGTLRLTDVLPSGLREFEIHRERYCWSVAAEVNETVELMRQKMEVLPALETLVVAISPAHMTSDVRYQTILKVACQDAGVELVDGGSRG